VNYLYMKRRSGRIHRIQSHSGSWKGGRSTAREKTKEYVILTTTEIISKVPSDSVALLREEIQSHQFGNKSFLS
jgi:hypothetical protein